MIDNDNKNAHLAVEFAKEFFKVYLEERNFSQVILMLDPEISWFGMDMQKICKSRQDVVQLMSDEAQMHGNGLQIEEQWYKTVCMNEEFCAVFGELQTVQNDPELLLLPLCVRFSLICRFKGEAVTLFHYHTSTQTQDELPALKLSQKRYEIAMRFSDVTMFEYNVLTGELILFEKDANRYNVPTVIPNAVEAFISKGIIESKDAAGYRAMYRQIHEGLPCANCFVTTKDVQGILRDFELHLTNVFDKDKRPVRAIGVRKNITQLRHLQREKQYSTSLASDQIFLYEVNVTQDHMIFVNQEWAKSLGVENITRFSEVKEIARQKTVDPQFHQILLQQLSPQNLTAVYESGRRLIYSDYRKKVGGQDYHWFRKNVNIIRDEFSNDIIIRCYNVDINEVKRKELRQKQDSKLYEAVMSKSTSAYEVNITQNLFLAGHEKWDVLFGITPTCVYSDMIEEIKKKALHPADKDCFYRQFGRHNLLNTYRSGSSIVACDYRRSNENGVFLWVRCTMHLYDDLQTGDVKAYAYIEDINEEKQRELSLIYNSEHDALTGLYNKAAAEKYITEYLSTGEGKTTTQAFLIIDIDRFKLVNDTFGHAFGDVVLSQVAAKIKDLFREMDIIGRVGGDEFIVLMKKIANKKAALDKAQEICNRVEDCFFKNGINYKISASIGIAFFKEHGRTYDELYRYSDTALYVSKEAGRNCFTVYANNMSLTPSSVKAIDENELLESKSFEHHVAQYVFKILYENSDRPSAIYSVLELIGKHYNFSRTYVFEDSADGKRLNNTFEWCNNGISPQMDNLQKVSYSSLGDYHKNFNADGIFFMPNISQTTPEVHAILQPQGIQSMIQFSICKNGKPLGFIGFDSCDRLWAPQKREVSTLQSVANTLALFIFEMRGVEESLIAKNTSLSIINALDSYAYVCDPTTYQILFANTRTMELAPSIQMGNLCYEALWNQQAPCAVCPMQTMIAANVPKLSMEMHNNNLDVWVRCTCSWIDWIGGEKMCLIDSVDITKYMMQKE